MKPAYLRLFLWDEAHHYVAKSYRVVARAAKKSGQRPARKGKGAR